MLFADHLGPEFPEWSIRFLPPIWRRMPSTLRAAGSIPRTFLASCRRIIANGFLNGSITVIAISKTLRQTVIFGQQDISRGVPFPRIDLVTCRNLLIYLKPELQQMVLDLFAYSLHQSRGYLFLGKAETARPTKATFELVNKKWKIYRCLGGPPGFPVHRAASVQRRSQPEAWNRETRRSSVGDQCSLNHWKLLRREADIAQLRRVNETMLRTRMWRSDHRSQCIAS